MRQRVGRSIARAKFINTALLGRKRPVMERVVDIAHVDSSKAIQPLMKELETDTTEARYKVLQSVLEIYDDEKNIEPALTKEFHKMYLDVAFEISLPPQMTALDASQPWMLYWIANSLKVMDRDWLSDDTKRKIVDKLFTISPSGGPFGGGPGQLSHLASTYAAINALSLCDNIDGCWDRIDRKGIYQWLISLKEPNGGFKTCLEVGEVDTRGIYCALSISTLLNILTEELTEGVLNYLKNCQNYEGGFGSCPHVDEAHGGYTFCATASLAILRSMDQINVEKLLEWSSARQLREERGFCGRSNKLVDGCYSFWVGGSAAILEAFGYGQCFNKHALRDYILYCCQEKEQPGLRDKPGAHSDFYHTNYCLLGLAVAESSYSCTPNDSPHNIKCTPDRLIGSSKLTDVNPVYGLPIENVRKIIHYFKSNLSSPS
ncbi:BMC_2a_G0008220.mRNA.1.CDS.1 [Saccharomyces cerevisiae]|nr:Ram1p [Saccharomyces cerevisiae YJM1447]CAI4320431.1 BMC_2a_G0008220.mRNA.1.CDS.1 [Saccharomyces cerevisiae]CAI4321681.1 BMB_G0008180.mRNA.1.CDS.1 [Saccharomyces cerevisiae]CAI7064724.1 BMC_2a_G0008220.mRNA.1.CDS.1 [Saccharomyces cerevisiae]CAI7065802.1 BMB_G0008180.mRNA.1.CDS.1 [Saccharomyces cerevisiae]